MRTNHLIGIVIISFCVTTGYSQGGWTEATNLVGNGEVVVSDMLIDTDGSIYITGRFNENIVSTAGSINSNGIFDIFFAKINASGEHEWIYGIGGPLFDLPGGIEIGPDTSIYLTGSVNGDVQFNDTTSISTNEMDAFIANYDTEGQLNWVKIVAGGSSNQRSEAMVVTQEKIVLTGLANDSVIYDNDTVTSPGFFSHISEFDLTGNHLAHNAIGFKDFGLSSSIISTPEGYVVSGYFRDSLICDIDTLYSAASGTSSDIYIYGVDDNLNGQWIRRTTSTFGENVPLGMKSDGNDDIYLVGKTGSLDLSIDSTETDKIQIIRTSGGEEFFIFNYKASTGNLDWYTIDGTSSRDALSDIDIFSDRLVSTGFISRDFFYNDDTLLNKTLTREIFIIQHDFDGNILHATLANSEPAHDSDQGYKVLRSPTNEIIISGVYRSEIINFGQFQFSNVSPGDPDIFIGKIGCLEFNDISISKEDILCFGDSTGTIDIEVSGGFGSPWKYSIDNGDTFQSALSYFDSLPAGDYPVIVIDKEKCAQPGPVVSINQPDSLTIEVIASSDVTDLENGSIQVEASGGTSPYTFRLQPDGDVDGVGTYFFAIEDTGIYYVEVDDLNNCGPVATDSIEINYLPTSLDPSNAPETRVYPNPTSGLFTLEMPIAVDACTIEVLSLSGQVVHSQHAYSSGGMITEVMDISHLSKGMYMLRVNGKTLRSGVVVN